jgi:hypothetical protein
MRFEVLVGGSVVKLMMIYDSFMENVTPLDHHQGGGVGVGRGLSLEGEGAGALGLGSKDSQ